MQTRASPNSYEYPRGLICLYDDGGAVIIYNIEMRTMEDDGASGWKLAGTSFDCEKVLQNQPCGKKLEYRIIVALN